jgi:hypothetical protein
VLCCIKHFLCLHLSWPHDGFLHKSKHVAKFFFVLQQYTRSVELILLLNYISHNFVLSEHYIKTAVLQCQNEFYAYENSKSEKTALTLYDPTSNLVRQYDFPVPLRCRKTSDTAFVAFVRPLSEPVRRFSSCSTDFNQQIAQFVFFLFLYVFLFQNCRIITSNPQTSFPPKTNKSWGLCGWQKNWIGKG